MWTLIKLVGILTDTSVAFVPLMGQPTMSLCHDMANILLGVTINKQDTADRYSVDLKFKQTHPPEPTPHKKAGKKMIEGEESGLKSDEKEKKIWSESSCEPT